MKASQKVNFDKNLKLLMNILSYLQTLSEIQQKINGFLENESNNEQDFSDLKSFLDSQNFMKNKNLLKEVLHLLLIISNNYYKNINVYKKIEFIIKNLKNSIQKHFSKFEIFNIFKDSKRLLLFLFQENLINFDYSVKAIISNLTSFKLEIIKLLLAQKKVDVNSTKIISSLNDNGLNVRYRKRRSDEMSCLHIAVQTGNPEIVKLLLSFKKINLNALSYTEENIDRYNANYKVLTMVVHANVKMMTPLAMAIKDQNVEIIKLLLECKGIDLIKESYDNDVNNFYESKKAGMWNFIKEDVKKTGCNALEIAKGTHNRQIIELVAKYFK